MSWNPIDNPIDYMTLDDRRSPGLCTISKLSIPRTFMVQKGFGFTGAIVIYTGLDVAKFTATLRLDTRQDWDDWHAWKPLVDTPPRGTRPRAKKAWHPFLEMLGVSAVLVEKLHQPVISDDMSSTIAIDFIQYRRPRLDLSKPDGAGDKKLDPNSAQIAVNSATIEGLKSALAGGEE